MRNYFLIPVFNDWESLEKLIFEIYNNTKDLKNILIDFLIVNDVNNKSKQN